MRRSYGTAYVTLESTPSLLDTPHNGFVDATRNATVPSRHSLSSFQITPRSPTFHTDIYWKMSYIRTAPTFHASRSPKGASMYKRHLIANPVGGVHSPQDKPVSHAYNLNSLDSSGCSGTNAGLKCAVDQKGTISLDRGSQDDGFGLSTSGPVWISRTN